MKPMPRADRLTEEFLSQVVEGVEEMLPDIAERYLLKSDSIELTDALPVWISDQNIPMHVDAMVEIAKPIHRFHHQIAFDGKARAYARSIISAAHDSDRVVEVVRSDLAERIADGIEWIEENVSLTADVRLLILVAYQLHALWLVGDSTSSFVVADHPFGEHPSRHRLYDEQDFLATVAALTPIRGMIGCD